MSKKLARNEGARPAPEPRAGPGAGADLKDVADRRAMARLLCDRPPEEVLVECERAGVRIAALGPVDGGHDAVETWRHVHDRRSRQPVIPDPARRLRQRVVDLHLGPAEAESLPRLADVSGKLEQPAVELRRRDVADHGTACRDGFAVGETDSTPTAVVDEDALDVGLGSASAAVVADQPHERVHESRTAAARNGHSGGLRPA